MTQHSLTEADELLDEWPHLRKPERVGRFRGLPREQTDNLFLALDSKSQSELVFALPEGERRLYIRLLAPDDAADLIQESPKHEREYLLELLDDATRQDARALLAYREDVAGGLMNPRFARLRPEASIDEAITYLRQQLSQVETIYYAYVLDEGQHLVGVVSLKGLVAAESNKTVKDVMTAKLHKVSEVTDQKKIAHLLSVHGIQAIPVVDAQGRMKGIVTADDLIDVLREEDTADMQKIGGMEALDGPYLETGFLALLRKRAGWLVVLFLGEMLTATAMARYEHQIEAAVVLALFIPLLISSGGNSGSQATTLIIRAMALGELRLGDWWRVVSRELAGGNRVGVLARRDRISTDRDLASGCEILWGTLPAGCSHHRTESAWRGHIWDCDGLHVAVYFATLRIGPGKRFRAFCGHLGRRQRDHHLLHGRQAHPDRNPFMSASRSIYPPW